MLSLMALPYLTEAVPETIYCINIMLDLLVYLLVGSAVRTGLGLVANERLVNGGVRVCSASARWVESLKTCEGRLKVEAVGIDVLGMPLVLWVLSVKKFDTLKNS